MVGVKSSAAIKNHLLLSLVAGRQRHGRHLARVGHHRVRAGVVAERRQPLFGRHLRHENVDREVELDVRGPRDRRHDIEDVPDRDDPRISNTRQ